MTSPELHLGVSIDGAGRHPAAWRLDGAHPERLFDAEHYVALAQSAERGLLDFVSLDDSFRLESDRAEDMRGHLDALLTLARVAPVTSRIGLVPTVTTTHTEPFHVSKNVATLDFVSLGRAGWLVDVSTTEAEAFHFGRRSVASTDELYAEAGEAIDVVSQLWDSWEDDAVIRDVSTGRYIDRRRLHVTDFEGRFFSVRGPSITPRSPQGQSLVVIEAVNAYALAVGVARADVIIVDVATVAQATALRDQIDEALRRAGRDPAVVSVLATIDVLLDHSEGGAASTRARLDALSAPLPAALAFDGAPAGLADLFATWAASGTVDGFLVRPVALPSTLSLLVDEVVPLLQSDGLFRTEYEGSTLRDHFGLARPRNRYAAAAAGES